VRQLLADKISGNMVGLWLLIPEHLRLGTWDLLCGWTQQPGVRVEPRLALQAVHEAALCTTGIRAKRCLAQKGFELTNGLPYVQRDGESNPNNFNLGSKITVSAGRRSMRCTRPRSNASARARRIVPMSSASRCRWRPR
jgi:hypothetical protein